MRLYWLLSLIVLLLSPIANATDYYWMANGSSTYGKYSTHSEAYSGYKDYLSANSGFKNWVDTGFSQKSPTEVRYDFTYISSGIKFVGFVSIDRYGNGCTPPKVYNDTTGGCEDPPSVCDAKAGQSVSWGLQIPGYLTSGSHGLHEYGQIDGCQVDLGSFQCDAANDGSDRGYCSGIGSFTGKPGNNEPGLGGPEDGIDHTEPPHTPDNPDECPEGMVPSGGGCVPKDPPELPSTGCEFSSDPNCGKEQPDNPDPGDDEPDHCDTSSDPSCTEDDGSEDNSGNGNGNGNGNGSDNGSDDGSDNGSDNGGGDGNGSGDGDNPDVSDDGNTDDDTGCDPVTDPYKCLKNPTDGGDKECDKPIACDGDPFQCAILQQAHKDSCDLRKLPDEKDKKELSDLIAKQQSELDGNGKELDGKVDGLFGTFKNAATGNTRQGACLTDAQFQVMGESFTLPFSKVCEFIHLFRFAVIAMAYVAAARIVSRAF